MYVLNGKKEHDAHQKQQRRKSIAYVFLVNKEMNLYVYENFVPLTY